MYDCEKHIKFVIEKFKGKVKDHIHEVLIVDNDSKDLSVKMAAKGLSELKEIKTTLIKNSRNYGLGGSYKIALNYAYENQYDYILVVYGDNTVDVNQFFKILNGNYFKFDLIIGNRLALNGIRQNYPYYRLMFNRLLSLISSVLTNYKIKDFRGGPISLLRVQSFLNKFENAIKNFPFDVELPQFLILYSLYKKMEICFENIEFTENESKKYHKSCSQFLKSLILLTKFTFKPKATVSKDKYGSFFGYTFKKIKFDSSGNLVSDYEFKSFTKKNRTFLDLNRVKSLKQDKVFPVMSKESIDENDSKICVHINLKSQHLLELELQKKLEDLAFKILPQKVAIVVYLDELINTKQCYDFVRFCADFKFHITVVSPRLADLIIWRGYAKLANNVILNYHHDRVSRSDFFYIVNEISSLTNLSVNVLTDQKYFYHCYGLKKKLEDLPLKSLILQPYPTINLSSIPEDHMNNLIDQQAVVEIFSSEEFSVKHSLNPIDSSLNLKDKFQQRIFEGFSQVLNLNDSKIMKKITW
jgi:hypothetical protein